MTKHNMEMVKGDTLAFFVKFTGLSSDMITSMDFTCKENDADGTDYIFNRTLSDGITKVSDGVYYVRVPPEATAEVTAGKYYYDLQIGVGSDIYTLLKGTMKLVQDITDN